MDLQNPCRRLCDGRTDKTKRAERRLLSARGMGALSSHAPPPGLLETLKITQGVGKKTLPLLIYCPSLFWSCARARAPSQKALRNSADDDDPIKKGEKKGGQLLLFFFSCIRSTRFRILKWKRDPIRISSPRGKKKKKSGRAGGRMDTVEKSRAQREREREGNHHPSCTLTWMWIPGRMRLSFYSRWDVVMSPQMFVCVGGNPRPKNYFEKKKKKTIWIWGKKKMAGLRKREREDQF